jgi:hypothetical protein
MRFFLPHFRHFFRGNKNIGEAFRQTQRLRLIFDIRLDFAFVPGKHVNGIPFHGRRFFFFGCVFHGLNNRRFLSGRQKQFDQLLQNLIGRKSVSGEDE